MENIHALLDDLNPINDRIDGLVTGFQGTIKITDTPTESGIYIPTEAGVYLNAGGLEYAPEGDDEGYLVMFINNGSEWVKNRVYLGIDISPLIQDVADIQSNKQNSLDHDGTGNKYPTVDAVNDGLAKAVPSLTVYKGHEIHLNKPLGGEVDFTLIKNDNRGFAIADVKEGDKFVISGRGGGAARLYGFIDINNKLLSVSLTTYTANNEEVIAPINSAKLIVNVTLDVDYSIKSQYGAFKSIESLNNTLKTILKDFALDKSKIFLKEKKEINIDVPIGGTVDLTPSYSEDRGHTVVSAKEGDVFVITGRGGFLPRLYAFLDSDNKLISMSEASELAADKKVVAPENTAKAIFNVNIQDGNYHYISAPISSAIDSVVNYLKKEEPVTEEPVTELPIFENYAVFIPTGTNVGDVIDLRLKKDDSWGSVIVNSKEGDRYLLSGRGGGTSKLYTFIDSSDKLISTIEASGTFSDLEVVAPERTKKAIFTVSVKPEYPYKIIADYDNGIETAVDGVQRNLLRFTEWINDKVDPNFVEKPYDPFIPELQKPANSDPTSDFNASTVQSSEIDSAFQDLINEYPEYLKRELCGKDQTGTYDIYKYSFIPLNYLDIISNPMKRKLKKIFITSNIHGDMGIGGGGDPKDISVIMYRFIKDLLGNYRDSRFLTMLRTNYEIYFIPVCNPWGFNHNHRRNGNDVDINRNFDTPDWESDNFGGSAPESEVETQYIVSFFNDVNPDFAIDIHSLGNVNENFKEQKIATIQQNILDNNLLLRAHQYNEYKIEVVFYTAGGVATARNWFEYVGKHGTLLEYCSFSNQDGNDQFSAKSMEQNYSLLVNYLFLLESKPKWVR